MSVKRVHAGRVIAFRHHRPASGAEQARRKAWGQRWGEVSRQVAGQIRQTKGAG